MSLIKLLYYQSDVGNFGDDLNAWLWPKLVPRISFFGKGDEVETNDTLFIGFGTILTQKHIPQKGRKIIFGTGVRPGVPVPDASWNLDVRFVRGPLSAQCFDVKHAYVSDSAMLVADCYPIAPRRKGIGLMPYFRSSQILDWRRICERLNLTYIDPHAPVEKTLSAISGVDRLITEAMHGAIVADSLRVPWTRYRCFSHLHEKEQVSEFKWNDWGQSINVSVDYETFPALLPKGKLGRWAHLFQRLGPERHVSRCFKHIVNHGRFRLSNDGVFCDALERMKNMVHQLRTETDGG